MTRQVLSSGLLLSVFCIGAAAQADTSSAPVVWERYRLSDRQLSIMLPKLPTVIDGRNLCNELEKDSYFAFADQVVYEFTVASKSREKIPSYCPVKKKFDGNTLTERLTELRTDKIKSREMSLIQDDGRQVYRFAYEFGTRLVILDLKKHRWIELAITRREDTKSEEERFVGSLDFSGADGKEIGDGAESTLGDAGFKAGVIPPGTKEPLVSDSFRILAKPKARYTNAARKANTQGSVLLTVTLLANGGIGSVTVIKKLPDGLTEQAVAAARKLVFLPKRVGGIPVTVIVTFDYGFSIY